MTIEQRLKAAQNHNLTPASTSTLFPTSSQPTLLRSSSAIGPTKNITPPNLTRSSSESWDFDLLDQPKPADPFSPILPTRARSPLVPNHQPTPRDNLLDLDQFPSTQSLDHNGVDSLLGNEFGPVEVSSEKLGAIALVDESDDDQDTLGALGRSIDQVQADRIKSSSVQQPSNGHQQKSRPSNRSDSPPPHILGQVVEIGFAPSVSRQALAQTRDPQSGAWDVPSAIEILLSTSQAEPPENFEPHPTSNQDPRFNKLGAQETARQNRVGTEDSRQSKSESIGGLAGVNTKEIQDQAAELLAQASAYGSTALGKAASFWKQSKASLTKVIEDQTGPSSSNASTNDGDPPIPKWMRDSQLPPHSSQHQQPSSPPVPFSDQSQADKRSSGMPASSSTSRQPYVSSSRRKVAERTIRKQPNEGPNGSVTKHSTQTDLLFSSSPTLLPVGSKEPPRSTKGNPGESSSDGKLPTYDFPTWPIVTLSPDLIRQTESYRLQGNELFKQGQYGAAEGAYSRALEIVLQEANASSVESAKVEKIYLGSLPILNNRSTARLKNGDGKGALTDVESVLGIILCEDRQEAGPERLKQRLEWTQKTRMPADLAAKKLEIDDQFAKALAKRARIHEDLEKWADARRDWETCRSLGSRVLAGAGGVKIVNEGLGRCAQAVGSGGRRGGGQAAPAGARATPRVNAQSQRIGEKKADEAVQRLREQQKKLAIEADERFEAQAEVDQLVGRWLAGKHTNLRALIGSLDAVLWPALAWKPVGFKDLLSDAQVKIAYLKAIAKVHPDKVPHSASVTQKLIAEAVFAALNHAWIAMNP